MYRVFTIIKNISSNLENCLKNNRMILGVSATGYAGYILREYMEIKTKMEKNCEIVTYNHSKANLKITTVETNNGCTVTIEDIPLAGADSSYTGET